MIKAFEAFPRLRIQETPPISPQYLSRQKDLANSLPYDSIILATKGRGDLPGEIPIYAIKYSRLHTEPGWAGMGGLALFHTTENEPIWGKRGANISYGGMWGIVGGHLDQGDDFLSALLREIKEESLLDQKDFLSIKAACSMIIYHPDGSWRTVDVLHKAVLLPGRFPQATEEMNSWEKTSWPRNPLPDLAAYMDAAQPYLRLI